MDASENGKLIDAWIALQYSDPNDWGDDPNVWAFKQLMELAHDSSRLCWEVILGIIARDSSDHILSNVGAGPLEDLLVHHGDELIAEVEQLADRDPVFRRALFGVWQNDMSDPLWYRVRAAARIE